MQNLSNLIGINLQKSISVNSSQNPLEALMRPAFTPPINNFNMQKKPTVQFNEPHTQLNLTVKSSYI